MCSGTPDSLSLPVCYCRTVSKKVWSGDIQKTTAEIIWEGRARLCLLRQVNGFDFSLRVNKYSPQMFVSDTVFFYIFFLLFLSLGLKNEQRGTCLLQNSVWVAQQASHCKPRWNLREIRQLGVEPLICTFPTSQPRAVQGSSPVSAWKVRHLGSGLSGIPTLARRGGWQQGHTLNFSPSEIQFFS